MTSPPPLPSTDEGRSAAFVTPYPDVDQVRASLTELHRGAPGFRWVGSPRAASGGMSGSAFPVDDIEAAVADVVSRQATRPTGIYVQVPTLAVAPGPYERGKARGATSLPGLWADLDYGVVGHKHDPDRHNGLTLPPDEAAARSVVDEAKLPAPSMWWHSGGGLYPLWLLGEPLVIGDRFDEVKAVSNRWQQAMVDASARCGWHYGNVGDLARVLRIPGTLNYKDPDRVRRARILEADGPRYTFEQLVGALPEVPPATVTPLRRPSRAEPTGDTKADFMAGAGQYSGPLGPFDALAEAATWADLLEPEGWTLVHVQTDGTEQWLRPGDPSSATSANAFEHNIVVHSTSAGLPSGADQRLTRGRLFAHLHHDGDASAAARDLLAAAAGDPTASAAAASLPANVLNTIRERCAVQPYGTAPAAESAGDGRSAPGAGVVASPGFLLAAEVWQASELLGHIYRAAVRFPACPDAVLQLLLAEVAAYLHHSTRLDTGVMRSSSLNAYVAAVGPSGVGKNAAMAVADELLAAWVQDATIMLRDVRRVPPGTGEGLIDSYFGERAVATDQLSKDGAPKMRTEWAQVRHNVLIVADEGRQALTVGGRSGATLFPVLCSAWTGGLAGTSNSERGGRRRELPADSYALGAVFGLQPEMAEGLFADGAGGLPQRFSYVPTLYPPISEIRTDYTEPGPLRLHIPPGEIRLTLDADARREIREARFAALAGRVEVPPLDGHRNLLRARTAGLLALLHHPAPEFGAGPAAGELTVEPMWWQIAGQVVNRSCALRDHLASLGERRMEAAREARHRATVAAGVETAQRVDHGKALGEVADQIAEAIKDGPRTTGDLGRKVVRASRRHLIEPAVELLVSRGTAATAPGSRRGSCVVSLAADGGE